MFNWSNRGKSGKDSEDSTSQPGVAGKGYTISTEDGITRLAPGTPLKARDREFGTCETPDGRRGTVFDGKGRAVDPPPADPLSWL